MQLGGLRLVWEVRSRSKVMPESTSHCLPEVWCKEGQFPLFDWKRKWWMQTVEMKWQIHMARQRRSWSDAVEATRSITWCRSSQRLCMAPHSHISYRGSKCTCFEFHRYISMQTKPKPALNKNVGVVDVMSLHRVRGLLWWRNDVHTPTQVNFETFIVTH